MNDETNKNLESNSSDVIRDDFKIEDASKVKPEPKKDDVIASSTQSDDVTNQGLDAVVNDDVNEKSEAIEETGNSDEAPAVTSETVISTDVNVTLDEQKNVVNVGSIEEVSVTVDSNLFNNLSESEISKDSVFNKKDDPGLVTGMKEGQEHLNEKKKFPFFMVFVFLIVVVSAFFIDDIVAFIEEYRNQKANVEGKGTVEDSVVEPAKIVSLEEIKTSFENSTEVIDFEKTNSIELTIITNENNISFTTTNYLDPTSELTLSVTFELNNNVLMAVCDISNSEFGKQMSIFLVKEIAKLQGVDSSKVDTYINDNLYTLTIDKGFEFTNSEDGNNTYKVATNIKLDIA